jgi:glycosyltransferase involved in cell wall biosynthesis
VIPRLVAGGSEKVLTTIAKHVDRTRFEVHLAVLDNENSDRPATLRDLALHSLKSRHTRYAGFGLLRLIRKLHPHVVLSAGGPTGVLAVAMAKLTRTRVIVRQGTMPASSASRLKPWVAFAFAWSRRHADRVICQSNAMAREVVTDSAVPPEKVRLLFNPVQLPEPSFLQDFPADGSPRFLVVSRLAPEKRVDLAIRAFAILQRQHGNASLTILGSGPCRQSLEVLANREVRAGSVKFTGYRPNPIHWMCESNLLVIASEFEGLPNVVLEALSVGLPVVAISCPGGLTDIAETTTRIRLVDEASPTALARAMSRAINERNRDLPGAAFWERFGMNPVIRQYEQLLDE